MAEGFVREAAHHGSPRNTSTATFMAPLIGFNHPAHNHGPLRLEALSNRDETQFVETAKSREIRASEGSVNHVEVFLMSVVVTPIFVETSTSYLYAIPIRPLHPGSRRAPFPYFDPQLSVPSTFPGRQASLATRSSQVASRWFIVGMMRSNTR